MQWRFEQMHEKIERLSQWHPKFALFPVKLGATKSWVWLENYERKVIVRNTYDGHVWKKFRRQIGSDWDVSQ